VKKLKEVMQHEKEESTAKKLILWNDKKKPVFLITGTALALVALFLLTHNPLSGGSNAERGVYFFYSEHCPHCQAVKPAVLELAEKRKITFYEVSKILKTSESHKKRIEEAGEYG